MNKFKVGDKVLCKRDNRIYNITNISLDYYIENEDGGMPATEIQLELVQTSEQIAVEKFKEEIKKGIQKEMDYISKHYNEIDNHQRCKLELQYCMQLLE